MSRASISTGGIDFPLSERQASGAQPNTADIPMHIAVLGDFSGRHNRGIHAPDSLGQRKAIEIDRDNIEDVFAGLNVELRLPVADQPLRFRELDDLHPDFIYQRVSLFDKMRLLKRKLKKPESFGEAAREITAWANYREQQENAVPAGIPPPENLLDAVLGQSDSDSQVNPGPQGDIDNLIKDIVRPYILPKADPRQPEMLDAVDAATSDLMRGIMHHTDFRQLEASWRALHFLIRRIETDAQLKVFLVDVSREEIEADLAGAATPEKSQLFQLLVAKHRVASGTPYSLMLGDYQLGNTEADAALASGLAAIAQASNAVWLSGGHECLAGCESLSGQPDADSWNPNPEEALPSAWRALRASPRAAHLALTAPRFMLRLPYGRATSSMESFDYEELPQSDNHNHYLWGNSAFLVALLLAESYRHQGWAFYPGDRQEIGNLPLHVYSREGESTLKPCAEVPLSDKGTARFRRAGLLAVRSVNTKDAVVIPNLNSTAENGATIRGRWLCQ